MSEPTCLISLQEIRSSSIAMSEHFFFLQSQIRNSAMRFIFQYMPIISLLIPGLRDLSGVFFVLKQRIKNGEGKTLLSRATEHKLPGIVKHLLDVGANPGYISPRTFAPLHTAAMRGQVGMVKMLLEAGADKNVEGRIGIPPLHYAAVNGYTNVVRLLLDAGAICGHRYTFLYTVRSGHTDIVRLLLDAGADKTICDGKRNSVLHFAVQFGHIDIVKLLLDAGMNTNVVDECHMTPLHRAVVNEDILSVELLTFSDPEKTALDIKSNAGRTALHIAAEKGNNDIVKLLLSAGANIDAQCKADFTPLHTAVKHGHTETVKLLLDNGADKSMENRYGKTAKYIAAELKSVEILSLLS